MPMEKKHKIYAGLVGAALLAWGVDAAFFGPPAAPGAAGGTATAAPVPAPEAAVTMPVPPPDVCAKGRDDRWLSGRLRAWAAENPTDPAGVRDVFTPSAAWAEGLRAKPAAAAATAAPGAAAAEFSRAHRLTAVVLAADGGGSAVIDGRLLRVGQSVGGCRLVAVRGGSADLIAPGGERFRVFIGTEEPAAAR